MHTAFSFKNLRPVEQQAIENQMKKELDDFREKGSFHYADYAEKAWDVIIDFLTGKEQGCFYLQALALHQRQKVRLLPVINGIPKITIFGHPDRVTAEFSLEGLFNPFLIRAYGYPGYEKIGKDVIGFIKRFETVLAELRKDEKDGSARHVDIAKIVDPGASK
jgi:hypothetical protein